MLPTARRQQVRGRRGVVNLVVGGVLLTLAAAGCSGSEGGSPVEVAQARVTAKERALTSAKDDLKAAKSSFCGASATYITTLDRYGDVLTQSAPTVGDVKDAGTELGQPREDVVSAAESAVAAQQAVTDAKQELADAEAALSAAKATGSASASPPATVASPEPLAPPATVALVKDAEAQFVTAQQGITDETPLTQASQQFNAAAVALEMSWLRLFSDAGCLTDEQQKQATRAVTDYTTALQKSLREAGYYDGEVDGVYGPETVDAVESLQEAHGLPSTGTVDAATAAALQDDLAAKGGAAAQEELATTAGVQQALKLAGYWDGPVDGEWTPELTKALKKLQTDLGVEPTGTVDAATVAAVEKAITEAQASASSSGSPSPSGSTSDSSTPAASSSSG
jgi:peptidoglycan hydrolase-like protein with peptidoglycan-binding domain